MAQTTSGTVTVQLRVKFIEPDLVNGGRFTLSTLSDALRDFGGLVELATLLVILTKPGHGVQWVKGDQARNTLVREMWQAKSGPRTYELSRVSYAAALELWLEIAVLPQVEIATATSRHISPKIADTVVDIWQRYIKLRSQRSHYVSEILVMDSIREDLRASRKVKRIELKRKLLISKNQVEEVESLIERGIEILPQIDEMSVELERVKP